MADEENSNLANSLKEKLHFHNYRYYVLDDPVISDFEYDRIFRQLVDLEENIPGLKAADSPTQRVGGAVSRIPGDPAPEPNAKFGKCFQR